MSTTPEEESSAKEASAADNSTTPSSSVDEQKDKGISVATSSAKESRENFLRRLESKKNNDPLPVSHEAEKEDDIKIDDIVAGFCNSEEKKKLTAGKDMAVKNTEEESINNSINIDPNDKVESATRPNKQSVGEQLLVDYLSKYCEPVPGNNAAAASSSPSVWIKDVDPSSLSFLKGLAGIQEPPPLTPSPNTNNNVTSFNATTNTQQQTSNQPTSLGRIKDDSDANNSMSSSANNTHKYKHQITPISKDEPTKVYEVYVPLHAIEGEPFELMVNGIRIKVLCPINAKPGSKIRFNLPLKLFEEGNGSGQQQGGFVPHPPPPPPPQPPSYTSVDPYWLMKDSLNKALDNAALSASLGTGSGATAGARDGKAKHDDDDAAKQPSSDSTSSTTNNNTDNNSLQHRMLSIIERQQHQLSDMQARIDALGGMLAQMQHDVGYLCHNSSLNQQQQQGGLRGNNGAPTQGYRIMGGLFGRGGTGALPQQLGTFPGQQGMQQQGMMNAHGLPEAVPAALPTHRGQRAPPVNQQQQQPPNQPLPAPPQEVPVAGDNAPRHEQVIQPNQGIFFPLFVMLFNFIVSLPRRVRALLLNTGPGRVYAHLREQAIERRAFANVDFGSIMKLVVMLLIFSGRVGGGGDSGGGGGRNNNNRRNNNNNNNQDEDEGSMTAYAYSLIQAMIGFWNGHRVHTLVLASFIAFLIQVGLMSFLYDVLWVERGDLLRAWLGRNRQDEDEQGATGAQGGAAAANDAAHEGGNNDGNVNNPQGQQRPQGQQQLRRHRPNAPQAAAGGLIRRGPENGGFFHDIQCLILSFLLSLIPAWRPEEAAGPEPEPAQQRPVEADQAADPQQTEPVGEDGAGDDNAAE